MTTDKLTFEEIQKLCKMIEDQSVQYTWIIPPKMMAYLRKHRGKNYDN